MTLPLNLDAIPVLITSGTALSAAIPLGADTLVGIAMPAAWTAAAMTFQVSVDGGTTWLELFDTTNTVVSITAPAASTYIQVSPTNWRGINNLKVRSGTSGSPVTQGADRNFFLICRPEIL